MSTRFFKPVDIAHVSFVTNSNCSFGPTPEKTFDQIINLSISQLGASHYKQESRTPGSESYLGIDSN